MSDEKCAVVGGGPAGCSAAVFAARFGLDVTVLDRGPSSLARCAHLGNYLGFPGGIDVETFTELMHAHVEACGGTVRSTTVESVRSLDAGGDDGGPGGFRLALQDGATVAATRIVAATKYGAGYLRKLDDGAMFAAPEDGGDPTFDRSYPDSDGRTPIEGLYVAGPLAGGGDQAIVAAGHGARVGREVVADVRRERGYWDRAADYRDWRRRDAERGAEWRDRDRWREWFDEHVAPEADLDPGRVERIREREIDRLLGSHLDGETIERRRADAHRRLAEALDDEALLAALDDDRIRAYLEREDAPADGGN